MEPKQNIVVHLVHGTWPFGPFKKSSGKTKAWFEAGSAVLANIEERVGHKIQFEEFHWSGKNTFFERMNAARKFSQQLAEGIGHGTEAKHVIIAHSHGGMVAAQALANLALSENERKGIKALVCLATPFVYLSPLNKLREALLFFGALGFICTALLIILLQSLFDLPYLWYLALCLGAPILFAGALFSLRVDPPPEYFAPLSRAHGIPTFLIRGTRDEAALVIGLAQILHLVTDAFYRSWEDGPTRRSTIDTALWTCAYVFVLIAGTLLTDRLNGDAFSLWALPSIFVFGAAALSCLYVAGYALIAVSAGLMNPRHWPTVIEVDSAPPNKECSIKSYFDLSTIEQTTLRHGIYELPEVQSDLAALIQAIERGMTPSLDNANEEPARAPIRA